MVFLEAGGLLLSGWRKKSRSEEQLMCLVVGSGEVTVQGRPECHHVLGYSSNQSRQASVFTQPAGRQAGHAGCVVEGSAGSGSLFSCRLKPDPASLSGWEGVGTTTTEPETGGYGISFSYPCAVNGGRTVRWFCERLDAIWRGLSCQFAWHHPPTPTR